MGAGASSPYSSDTDTSTDTDPRSGYCTSTRVFHSMHTSSFSPSSDVPFVFSAFALFFLPNLLPLPTVAAASQPTLIDAARQQSAYATELVVPLSLELLWLGFFLRLRALSLYVSSGILPMSPPDVHVFVVSFYGNKHA
ncbi:hypothetical protein ZEAMMB73_Zm00001d037683 [Zea mays]|uniref:Uncharacterized protein n=1 Tax=Zea mays TaxID=4577 RepID=A0A1D6LZQ0_MAIZE|nr:hypothetical protein ZEAMMB73_Zm00001d037683 [Zea mays]